MTETAVQVPCLGRAFELGMVYDCIEDLPQLENVYKQNELKNMCEEEGMAHESFQVYPSDNIEKWASAVGLTDSLKTSILCGLVELVDSYKYISEMLVPTGQARVTLHYKAITRRKKMLPLYYTGGNQNKSGTGTHFVTDLAYGVQAFFVFHRDVRGNEQQKCAEKKMENLISKLTQTQGEFTPVLNEEETEELTRLTCIAHGDLDKPRSCKTGMDVLNILKKPKVYLFQRGETEIPIEATLRPLGNFRPIKVLGHVHVEKIQTLLLGLESLVKTCERLHPACSAKLLILSRMRIQKMKCILEEYSHKFKRQLAEWIKGNRRGDKHIENKLSTLFKTNEMSVFSLSKLQQWMRQMETMVQVFTICQNGFDANFVQVVDKGGFNRLMKDKDKHLIFFSIPLGISRDQYLDKLEKCEVHTANTYGVQLQQILRKDQLIPEAESFSEFAAANKNNTSTNFAVFIREQSHITGCFIREKGNPKSEREFKPPQKPIRVDIAGFSHNAFRVKFEAPTSGIQEVLSYSVMHRKLPAGKYISQECKSEKSVPGIIQTVIGNLEPSTKYEIAIAGICRNNIGMTAATTTRGETSNTSKSDVMSAKDADYTVNTGAARDLALIEHMKKGGSVLEDRNTSPTLMKIYQTPMQKRFINCGGDHLFYNAGDETQPKSNHRVIMLLGSSGSGKSSLLDGIINHVLGVKWRDNFRFKITSSLLHMDSQVLSQTKCITTYTIGRHKDLSIPFGITIIDTPGIGSSGLAHDNKLIGDLREFIHQSEHVFGKMHAIGFVIPASQGRLTKTQMYIHDTIRSLFGKTVLAQTWFLVTFADNQTPPVLNAIEEAGIPINNTPLVFNNSAWFAKNRSGQDENSKRRGSDSSEDDEPQGDFGKIFWKMGKRSFRKFFSALGGSGGKSLNSRAFAPGEQEHLEHVANDLQEQIRVTCWEYGRCLREATILKDYINSNCRKRTETNVFSVTKKVEDTNKYATNCKHCKYTCHFPCDERECLAMKDGVCGVCPNKCSIDRHARSKQIFKNTLIIEPINERHVVRRYKTSGKLDLNQITAGCREMCETLSQITVSMIKQYYDCLVRLNKGSGISTYIDAAGVIALLKEKEQMDKRTGWEEVDLVLELLKTDAISYIHQYRM